MISDILEEVANEVCKNLCKYYETTDEDAICDYMREHDRACPLDKLM